MILSTFLQAMMKSERLVLIAFLDPQPYRGQSMGRRWQRGHTRVYIIAALERKG